MPAFAGTLNAPFWAGVIEDMYRWTADCHASEPFWLADEGIPLELVTQDLYIGHNRSLLWFIHLFINEALGRWAGRVFKKSELTRDSSDP